MFKIVFLVVRDTVLGKIIFLMQCTTVDEKRLVYRGVRENFRLGL